MFKMHTPTVCKSYLDIYYKFKYKKGPYFPGLYLPSHVMVGFRPLGKSPSTLLQGKLPLSETPASPGFIPFQKHTAKSPGKLAALCCSLETSFHVLRQWNSLFAIQINITGLITLFIKSVCRKMRLQSLHKSGFPDLRSHSNSSSKPISNGECKQRGRRR